MQSQASFNVFHVNHLNDISENPFHLAVSLCYTAPAVPHSYFKTSPIFIAFHDGTEQKGQQLPLHSLLCKYVR